MKKLLMSMFVGVFLGCAPEAPRQERNERAASVTAVVELSLPKPTLRQVVPAVKLKTPSRLLTSKLPVLKLRQRFVLPRATPSAI
jgi:hypothetical protein